MSNCIFNLSDLLNSSQQLRDSLLDRLSPIVDYGYSIEALKKEFLREVKQVAESFLINPSNIEDALKVLEEESFKDEIDFIFDEEAIPSKEELRATMLSWQQVTTLETENTSTDRLDNQEKNPKPIIDDPVSYYYKKALRSKIRAEQHVSKVMVNSILYDENGIVTDTNTMNLAIKNQQEKLLQTIIKYLNSRGYNFSGTMYDENDLYTGIVEEIKSKIGDFFRFDFNELNNFYNSRNFELLDALSSWTILTNYDTLLKKTFGKAININPDKAQYNIGKYSAGGGSNVYSTWRVNEEIDLSKEINNISLAIITSLPYYYADTTSPTGVRNLKFNEFVYLIAKLKDAPINYKYDLIFGVDTFGDAWRNLSNSTKKFLDGKSVFQVISLMRTNPQEYLPPLMEALNSESIFNSINEALGGQYFENIDRNIINTIYQGLFNPQNTKSLYYILNLTGFNKTNYYAFISQTIDSIFKASFLQYARNSKGEIYVRPMYDLSLSKIEADIEGGINKINSKGMTSNYEITRSKYYITDDLEGEYNYKDLEDNVINYFNIDGKNYEVVKLGDSITIRNTDRTPVTDLNILNKINDEAKLRFGIPTEVKYIILDYYKGPLEVRINLVNGKISYFLEGFETMFMSEEDYKSLAPVIENVLKQNFIIDQEYLLTFGSKISATSDFYPAVTLDLMNLTSRVIANQYISNNYFKGVPPSLADKKIEKIYKTNAPTFNRKTGELNFVTSADTTTIKNLAYAKAVVTGRLTSSLILDGEGNALASSALSRLINSLLYLVEVQVKNPDAAAKDFTLWKPGVYKGVRLLKEFKDQGVNTSKAHTEFSAREMESALVFIDYVHGLSNQGDTKTIYTDGLVGFYPSENSDKTYVGRLLIDLKNILIGETNLYELIRKNPQNIRSFYPIIRKELGDFYNKALENINKEWQRVGDILGISVSYGHWDLLNDLANSYGITPSLLVDETITEYNFNNPFNPIVLTDLVHYVKDKNGNYLVNLSLMENIRILSNDINFEDYIQYINHKVLRTLLNDEVSITATPEILKVLGDQADLWIDPYTNKLILAKEYDPDGEIVRNIRREWELDENYFHLEINPILTSYNVLNYFFTQEYMNSAVGAYYGHPNKKMVNPSIATNKDIELDIEARKNAQDKRNVSYTAAMHQFLLNLLDGVPPEINIAPIKDVEDKFITISGDSFDITPFDGATFVNPFFAILENNSLCGAKVGKIKKTFIHAYNHKTGTGIIIKDAEYPLTNEYIRRSKLYENLMLNMTDRVWRGKNGEPVIVDITKDYHGNPIHLHNNESSDGSMYFLDSKTGKYYTFIIESNGNNLYTRTILEVDEHAIPQGDPTTEIWNVDTNYKLWKMLGGERSMKFSKGRFSQSEHSITQIVDIMNNTSDVTIEGDVKYQSEVWLPLKHSDIHLMPTEGAIKLGIANVNSNNTFAIADPTKINHTRIALNQAGVQLDKEHHADNGDLSIMTQVISACAARGYTLEKTQSLIEALSSLAEAGIRPYISEFREFFRAGESSQEVLEGHRQKFEQVLLKTLVNALMNSSNSDNIVQIVSQELIEKAKAGKEIDFANINIPLSDPSVMRRLHSIISVALTLAAIKIKVDGNLNVLCPSFNVVKVFNGKMREDFLNDDEIIAEQERWNNDPKSELVGRIYNIKLGRTYRLVGKDGSISYQLIQTQKDYWELKRNSYKYTSIKELFAPVPAQHKLRDPQEIIDEIYKLNSYEKRMQKAEELGLHIDLDTTPSNLVEYVAANFPKLAKKSIEKETGFSDNDVKKLAGIYIGGNTTSIMRAAEALAAESPYPTDSQQVRDIIEGILSSIERSSELYRYIEKLRLDEAIKGYQDDYDREDEEIHRPNARPEFEGGRELASYNVIFSGNILPTTLSNIIVTGDPRTTKQKALEIGGIDTLRHPDANGMHFGNPFSHLEKEVREGRAKVFMPTVREAVQAFELWLDGTAYLDVEPERRQWILDQINSGKLSGKTLVYYTNTIKDSEGTHYYNPKTFPNHALVLQRKINEKDAELAGPLFLQNLQTGSFNLYDLVSVHKLSDLKESGDYTKEELDSALAELQEDLNILHSKEGGQVLTDEGYVLVDPKSVKVEPYEIVLPKIFATVFGLTENDNLDSIKKDPEFFTKRLFENITPTHNNYTITLQRTSGNHVYILNSNDAIQTDNFYPKTINTIIENGKKYRTINGEKIYELGINDNVWEYVDADGTAYDVIIADDPISYTEKFDDYVTINVNKDSQNLQKTIDLLRNSKNKAIVNYIAAIDKQLSYEGATIQTAVEDVLEIDKNTYKDSPLGYYYINLGREIYASFLKSLEVVVARVPAQSMLSFMPMKVVGFEKSDINTAYVATTQFLFLGSDLDIDADSIAAFSFDKSGRYIMHSPYANISSYELLKASQEIPFPTGITIEISDDLLPFDYSSIVRTKSKKELDIMLEASKQRPDLVLFTELDYQREMNKPFFFGGGEITVVNLNKDQIDNFINIVEQANYYRGLPPANTQETSIMAQQIVGIINHHNKYLNSKKVTDFAKNFVVSTMYDIGISPANLIESQQAMDYITLPLKDVGNSTKKAQVIRYTGDPANFATNIKGFVENMAGKKSVGICAVGLKTFFAATARYNEVLAHGTPEEVARLKSDVVIAGKHFRVLANTYTTNEVNAAILGTILQEVDLGTDAALLLSGLLSLATDNAKELLINKLNAANMLGMYIYGISIGMNFLDIANIIASDTGQIIDKLSNSDIINDERSLSMENIFDYIELGPVLTISHTVPKTLNTSILLLKNLREMAWLGIYPTTSKEGTKMSVELIIDRLESLKISPSLEFSAGIIEYNLNIEKALKYILLVDKIKKDLAIVNGTLLYYNTDEKGELLKDLNTGFVRVNSGIYGAIKKLYRGGEEFRRAGELLHINLGNETSYARALNYIDKVESAIASAQYLNYRERLRKSKLRGDEKSPDNVSSMYYFNMHKFIFNPFYREGVIDLYEGTCNKEKFMSSPEYREIFLQVYNSQKDKDVESAYNYINDKRLYPTKTFLNILDTLQVNHYMSYLKSADMLHQYMQNSIKYRSIYLLGKRAIQEIGAYSQADKEYIFKRTEQFIDRLIRDRYFTFKNITFDIPAGLPFFTGTGEITRNTSESILKIKLGTRAGNASFKLLMETVIIPQLKELPEFKDNKFIQSLNAVTSDSNPELQSIIGFAPNINMSPRSDTDIALFEEVKYDFNRLSTSNYTYSSGGIKYSLIDLFFYYNLITFGGRIGESTMTTIFLDVQDYRAIKNFRDFESYQDKYGVFSLSDPLNQIQGNISLDTLIRETAPRAYPSITKLNHFYAEDYSTGKLSYYSRNRNRVVYSEEFGKVVGPKYTGIEVPYAHDDDYKNYIVQSSDSDAAFAHFKTKSGKLVRIKLEKGTISEIYVDGVPLDMELLKYDEFFTHLPVITQISPEGIIEKYYNRSKIMSKIEELINC